MSENKDFLDEIFKSDEKPAEAENFDNLLEDRDLSVGDGIFSENLIERVDSDGNPIGREKTVMPAEPEVDVPEEEEVLKTVKHSHQTKRKSTEKSKSSTQKSFMTKVKGTILSAAATTAEKYKESKEKREAEKAERRKAEKADASAKKALMIEDNSDVQSKESVKAEGNKIIMRRRERSVGCFGGILYFLFIACVSIVLGSLGWMFASDMLGMSTTEGEVVKIIVPDDFTIDSITDMLYEKEIVSYKFLFKFYAKLSSAEEKIEAGTYELNTESDYRALVNDMRGKRGKRVEVQVTIPEGYTMYQIFNTLEKNKVCTADELWRAAEEFDFNYDFLDREALGNPRRLEGYLFPDTYKFYENDTPENAISKFLDNFATKWKAAYTERANELGRTMDDILIIASIIEKEAGRVNEMGNVASVIYNRLKANMTLGMESTLNYIIEGTDEEIDTEVDNPYNTYKYQGLPAGAIANPGADSIYAALYPESTGYYYFALGKDGYTHFFTNYDAFRNFVNSDKYGG